MKKIILPIAAVAMATAPVIATAAEVERGTEAAESTSEMGGSATILAVLAAAAVIVGIIIAVDDDEDEPVSV